MNYYTISIEIFVSYFDKNILKYIYLERCRLNGLYIDFKIDTDGSNISR